MDSEKYHLIQLNVFYSNKSANTPMESDGTQLLARFSSCEAIMT